MDGAKQLTLRAFLFCNIHNNLVDLISHVEGIVDPAPCLHLLMLFQIGLVDSQLIICNCSNTRSALCKAQACMQTLVKPMCIRLDLAVGSGFTFVCIHIMYHTTSAQAGEQVRIAQNN